MNTRDLEKTFYTIDQLKQVPVNDNGESLVDMSAVDNTITLEIQEDNVPCTGNTIFVRDSVAQKLVLMHRALLDVGLGLKVTDGYRPMQVQEGYWKWRLEKDGREHPELKGEALENFSMKFTAKPEYAYHPTGGAVDVTIIELDTGRELEMGTPIDHFSEKSYSHNQDLPQEALDNRNLLFELMEKHDFYNFPSEWWHFSYGTLDWALYYKQPHAIYGAVEFCTKQ